MFILIFAPLIINRCKRFLNTSRQDYSTDSGNEIFQELCFELLDIIKKQEIPKEKLFGVISGKLKNSFQKVLKSKLEETRQNISSTEEIPDSVSCEQVQKMHIAGLIDKISHLEIVDAGEFLDEMVRVHVITASTRDFLAENIIDGKSMTGMSPDKKMIAALRKRKSRALKSICKYLIE